MMGRQNFSVGGEARRFVRTRYVLLVGLLIGLIVAQCLALRSFNYAASQVEHLDVRKAMLAPQSQFRDGELFLDLEAYRSSPQLEEFRTFFRQNCGSKKGTEAALALANRLRISSEFGPDRDEFLMPTHDPAANLKTVLGGATSHCVSRSALVVTSLLSMGIPARVVQLVPNDGKGHNVAEVWADGRWILVDPSYGGLIATTRGPCSAAEALLTPYAVTFISIVPPASRAQPPLQHYAEHGPRFFKDRIVYPEPWLYTRVGRRVAPWPFRGRFTIVGSGGWAYGPAQSLLRGGIFVCMMMLLYVVLNGVFRGEMLGQKKNRTDEKRITLQERLGLPAECGARSRPAGSSKGAAISPTGGRRTPDAARAPSAAHELGGAESRGPRGHGSSPSPDGEST